MDVEGWKAQMRRGAAELAILALLEKQERYGLELLEVLRSSPEIGVADGTIYPLLSRLEKEGRIASRWAPDLGAGPPRKYYRLAPAGAESLAAMRPIWAAFRKQLDAILGDAG